MTDGISLLANTNRLLKSYWLSCVRLLLPSQSNSGTAAIWYNEERYRKLSFVRYLVKLLLQGSPRWQSGKQNLQKLCHESKWVGNPSRQYSACAQSKYDSFAMSFSCYRQLNGVHGGKQKGCKSINGMLGKAFNRGRLISLGISDRVALIKFWHFRS